MDGSLLKASATGRYQSDAAERDVRVLRGVKHVSNLITIVPPVKTADVTHTIEEAYRRSADLDARRVQVEATDGKAGRLMITFSYRRQPWDLSGSLRSASWLACSRA
jgi:osmotically-inducible protein OsmY